MHVNKPPIALDERVQGKTFPQGLWGVLKKALEKKPEDRYTTAAEFADSLKPFAGGAGKGFTAMMPANSSAVLEQAAKQHAAALEAAKAAAAPAAAPGAGPAPIKPAPTVKMAALPGPGGARTPGPARPATSAIALVAIAAPYAPIWLPRRPAC
jgi:serine/threonine-protein kinase